MLSLDQSVDDSAWITEDRGALYASDSGANTVNVITGDFRPGTAFTSATPCSANSARSTCTTPNFLGILNLTTGHVSPVSLRGTLAPGGLIFVPGSQHHGDGEQESDGVAGRPPGGAPRGSGVAARELI